MYLAFIGRLCKPPNRREHEEDVERCNSAILSKESQLVNMACVSVISSVVNYLHTQVPKYYLITMSSI